MCTAIATSHCNLIQILVEHVTYLRCYCLQAQAKETTEGSEGNPSYPHPKLVFNDIYSNMFKPTMLFRNKKDGRLSNLRLNLADLEVQTQSTPLSSSTLLTVSTIPFQYVLLNHS